MARGGLCSKESILISECLSVARRCWVHPFFASCGRPGRSSGQWAAVESSPAIIKTLHARPFLSLLNASGKHGLSCHTSALTLPGLALSSSFIVSLQPHHLLHLSSLFDNTHSLPNSAPPASPLSRPPARQLASFRLPSAGCRCHSSHLDDSSPSVHSSLATPLTHIFC